MITNPRNYFSGSCTVADLKNQIMSAVWDCIGSDLKEKLKDSDSPFDREKYYEFNRTLGDVLDKFIGMVGVKHQVSREYRKDFPDEYVHNALARQIADFLFESKAVAVRKLESDYHPTIDYYLEIPFLKCQASPTPRAEKGE